MNVDRRAWRALFAAQLGWMLDAMDFLLFTFAVLPIQKEFGLASSTMGLMTSIALLAGSVGGIAFGLLADRIGRVRALTFSILLYSLATAGLATAQSPWQLFVWRLLVGLGMAGEWSCGSVLVAETWPAEYRGKAMGLMQSAWAIGAMLAAAISSVVLERFGWRVLFLFGALPAIAAFAIRRGVEEPAVWREQNVRPRFADLFGPLLRRRVVIATAIASSVLIAYWGLTSWLPAFLASPVAAGGAGLTLTKSARWLIVLQSGAFLGYVTFGWIADRIGRRPAFTLFVIGAAIVVPIFAFGARSPLMLLTIGPLVGYFGHGYFSVFGAMLAELFPTHIRATAQGFCYNAGRCFSVLAPFGIGALMPRLGIGVLLACDALFFALGGALIWLLPETKGAEV